MEAASKQRTVVRRQFSKNCNDLVDLLQQLDNKLKFERISKSEIVDELYIKLKTLDKIIEDALIIDPNFDENLYEKELEESQKYAEKYKIVKEKLRDAREETTESPKRSTFRNYKIPNLELPKFDGNIKNWLPFWNQFKKIHEDLDIDATDKYQYLLQSTIDGTEVRTFIESFPANDRSYAECIDELKSRYARDDVLIQIYVRELLNIILNKNNTESVVELYDKINAQLRALSTLGVTRDKYAAFLLPLIESALPTEIIRTWERNKPVCKDELAELMAFLKREVESEQRIKLAETSFSNNESRSGKERNVEPSVGCFLVENKREKNKKIKCIWCEKESHSSLECYKISKMSIDERKEHLRKIRACGICLRIGHHPRVCKAYVKCYVCGRRHSPVMCEGTQTKETNDKKTPTAVATQCAQASNVTLLQTLTVTICHGDKKQEVRALIDNGAQRSYIREDIAESLGLPVIDREVVSHTLFGGVQVGSKTHNVYSFSVKNQTETYSVKITGLGQKCISKNIPRYNDNDCNLNKILLKNNINLSDKWDGDIELLIGADFSGFIMTNTLISLENGMLAVLTKLGWVLQGKQTQVVSNNNVNTLLCSSDLSGFWSLELLGIKDPVEVKTKAQEEVDAVMSFERSIRINMEGRYETTLPWKVGYEELLSNRVLAERRLESTTKRLKSLGKLSDYSTIFQEWLKAGIIETVEPRQGKNAYGLHYLPHRGVIKESSLTTKLRPVFDASAKDLSGRSLNSYLNKGVNFLDKIPNLLVGFRKGKIGVTSDIAKAFLMISVASVDRDFLRFLWWRDETCSEIIEYRHCRVVFGLTSSPFLLSATIDHHLNSVTGRLKSTAQHLRKSFYVDNSLASLDSEEETQRFIIEAKEVMAKGKFNLRQWVTSPSAAVNDTNMSVMSVLGLQWYIDTDELGCNLNSLPKLENLGHVTKRNLMSIVHSIFDPVGFSCPATLLPRLLIQESWKRDLAWDEELPDNMKNSFMKWYGQIEYLNLCRVPRRFTDVDVIGACQLSLHLFCDASKDAYCACVFLRSEKNDIVSVQLISAKTRVAPPERMTIPRLELTAVLIGSRLLRNVRDNLNITCDEFCWTDSLVALCWVKKDLPWNNYICNRVKEIKSNTNLRDWRHIPGSMNPADLASRGCSPEQLYISRWWEGPEWLRQHSMYWPESSVAMNEKDACVELRKTMCKTNICLEDEAFSSRFNHISSYSRIIRVLIYMKRFIYNIRNKNCKKLGVLAYEEFEEAEMNIMKMIQKENREYIKQKSININTFYGDDGLLRIKTKLLLSDFPETTKKPIILPGCGFLVRKLVEQRHLELQHVGVNQLIVDIRTNFWILGIRRLVKSVVEKCTICTRFRAKPTEVTPAPLPKERMGSVKPFEVSGIDLAGPLSLKDGRKCWVVLYTCAVYRAVHLELTTSLSAEAFLLTLRRFIARRGRVRQIITDNGTNFTSTKHALSVIDWDKVRGSTMAQRISWKLNAPTAAWWGGFWERLIRILKGLLRRVLGKSQVYYDELHTLLCECEAVMNGRPLTYIQDEKAVSLEPLTPASFIQPIAETDVTDLDEICIGSRYKYLLKLREDFKCRFRNEYLTSLIEKKKDKHNNLRIGDVVLIESEDKRVKWPLGLVINIFEGKDGVCRTAEVKTSTGTKIRPFQKLYPLEISSADAEGLPVTAPTVTDLKARSGGPVGLPIIAPAVSDFKTRCGRSVLIPSRYRM